MRVVLSSDIKAKVEPPATIREYMSPGAGMANLSITEVALPSGSATTDHMHDTDQVVYVLEGEALFVGSDGEQFHLRTGDMIYIPAGVVHRHVCAGAETLRQLAIFVTPTGAEAGRSQTG
jgi:quercetin dioxygenase-like cupin family protein